jgi:hypothetical protein
MCHLPESIPMKPILVQKPLDMGRTPCIPVMECPEYEVRVLLQQMGNGTWKQIWVCNSCPGLFKDWDGLRARIMTCYHHAMWAW